MKLKNVNILNHLCRVCVNKKHKHTMERWFLKSNNLTFCLIASMILLVVFFCIGIVIYAVEFDKPLSWSMLGSYWALLVLPNSCEDIASLTFYYRWFLITIVLADVIVVISQCYSHLKNYLFNARNYILISRAFHRRWDSTTRTYVVPRFLSFTHLQAVLGLKMDDILNAVANRPIRVRSLSAKYAAYEPSQPFLVLEIFPKNTCYGCKIDRGANVTFVAPTCASEACFSSLAFNIAKFGGFNYISKEIEENREYKTSYYNIDGESKDRVRDAYINDLKQLCKGGGWCIFLIGIGDSSRLKGEEQFHLEHQYKNSKVSTIVSAGDYNKLKGALMTHLQALPNRTPFTVSENKYKFLSDEKFVGRILQESNADLNILTIRVNYSVVGWYDQPTLLAKTIAEAINTIKKTKPTYLFPKGLGYEGLLD